MGSSTWARFRKPAWCGVTRSAAKLKAWGAFHQTRGNVICYRLLPGATTSYTALWVCTIASCGPLDITTGSKKQILPDALTQTQGIPEVWVGADGEVYGRAGRTSFRCLPERIEIGKTQRELRRSPLHAGDNIVGGIDGAGRLVLTSAKTGKVTRVPTPYEGSPRAVFSVGCERAGRIYGGTIFPAASFCYDSRTSELSRLGRLSTAPIQVYDTLDHPRGLFLSSYMPASVDFFDPGKEIKRPDNPRHVVSVPGQERPVQLVIGPDGMIYTGTFPSKGRLGGALVRVDPTNLSHQAWVNVISNQSIAHLAAIPETGELFCTTSVMGGSSAIPSEKAACVFLWDCRHEKLAFRSQPIPGAKGYGAAVRARNGIIYGVAGAAYYAFDPRSRKTIFTGVLPVKALHFPDLSDEPAGPRGLIYGIGDDAIFTIDPADHSSRILVRHKSLKRAQGFYVTADQTLYYGAGSHLMRCRLAE